MQLKYLKPTVERLIDLRGVFRVIYRTSFDAAKFGDSEYV